jgi:hypothetical protein
MPKCEVKEEEEIRAPRRRLLIGGGIAFCETKVEVKEEEEERDRVAALLREQRLNATSDDPSDTPRFNAAFMSSLNDHTAWAGTSGTAAPSPSGRQQGRYQRQWHGEGGAVRRPLRPLRALRRALPPHRAPRPKPSLD